MYYAQTACYTMCIQCCSPAIENLTVDNVLINRISATLGARDSSLLVGITGDTRMRGGKSGWVNSLIADLPTSSRVVSKYTYHRLRESVFQREQ